MSEKTSFVPYQGKEESISKQPIKAGSLYFSTDSGRMYLDTSENARIPIGGAGAAIYYAKVDGIEEEISADEKIYKIDIKGLEKETDKPKINDIILSADKTFYKILDITEENFICEQLAITGGTSSGPPVSLKKPEFFIDSSSYNSNVINKSEVKIYFTARSLENDRGELLSSQLQVIYELREKGSSVYYDQGSITVNSGERSFIDITKKLRDDRTTNVYFKVIGSNHDAPFENTLYPGATITTTKLILQHDSTFSNDLVYKKNQMTFTFKAEGNIEKILQFYFDDNLEEVRELSATSSSNQTYTFDSKLGTHGVHTVKVVLYQSVNGSPGIKAGELEFEIAVQVEGDNSPIIWTNSYKDIYYNYESIKIPILAFDPLNSSSPQVRLYKDGIELDNSPLTLDKNQLGEDSLEDGFFLWEIANAEVDQYNYYSISCSNDAARVEKEIVFQVLKDDRNIDIYQEYLLLNFDPKGRSNLESTTLRQQWKNKDGESAIFSNFNWYNNGWVMDGGNTVLRISNGASFSIPIQELVFNSSTLTTEQSNSIEISFKIHNIQDYSNLVKNITRYIGDSDYYNEFLTSSYDNYDAFLQAQYPDIYENLKFSHVQKNINLNNIVCGLYSDAGDGSTPVGLCIGTQDAFFSNGTNTVSLSFVEDEIINLSAVYDNSLKLLLIYINGVITGVIKSTVSDIFKITSGEIVFNSNLCDIDLLKVRVYNTGLSVMDVVKNFAVDRKDIDSFLQADLASNNTALKEYQMSYDKIINYNDLNPDDYTMPYIIFDTSKLLNDNDKLSYSKENKKYIDVTFVNTGLERAYEKGELLELAIKDGLCSAASNDQQKQEAVKLYYKHHCPSWTGNNIELVVQGTSSEFYPRRNYKIKTKTKQDDDGQERIHIFLNKGPYAKDYASDVSKLNNGEISLGEETTRQDFWYMNNYTNGTHKWTMKVDFMESSGSYNAGFASLVGNSYTKHPLEDYISSGAITADNRLYGVNKKLNWQDYRTSLLGFPVMAFQKVDATTYNFIGYYRMLLDKGSDEVLGFKPHKEILQNFLSSQKVRDVAECWEFSNNARTFCSYRDPWNRVLFGFNPPKSKENDSDSYTSKGAPIVTDSFEYRYHSEDKLLDLIYKYSEKISDLQKKGIYSQLEAAEKTFELYKNWEKACQWVWSTNMDNVISQNSYSTVTVGKVVYEPNKYFYEDDDGNRVMSSGDYVAGRVYYSQTYDSTLNEYVYVNAYVVGSENYKYETNKFYIKSNNDFILCSDAQFDESYVYYEATAIQESELSKQCDLLVKPANISLGIQTDVEYYICNRDNTIEDLLVNKKLTYEKKHYPTQEELNKGLYYVANPVKYGNIEYKYDTKEYRNAKFIYDLEKHFDLEYLSVYFVMTEVFECYDSRGKNCMMASWGPKTLNTDYIWYPIFYDIDTQLGINNTGIPSFTFNVDTTINNNYSTSDSILWNNFFKNFKNSHILTTYNRLRGNGEGLKNPPLKSVDYIEKWYTFDPDEKITNNIAARGIRPLIATNLDMYFKYITIANDKAPGQGVGYLGQDGTWGEPTEGFFYALQGDRSQSRKQFLTNRLDYIDSWLTVGNYARAGYNRIRGRISANDISGNIISDRWVETLEDSYWMDETETQKSHEFDAEYWLNLKPIYSSYVTAGDDSANYPSQKYDGITPKKFELSALKPGIRGSANYPEQLVYIYGMNKMSDVGDMSNLYWREFYLEGNADKLVRLKLGHDGLDEDGDPWYNRQLNGITIPKKLPLLKEMNLCNITLTAEQTLDLTFSEKLENFRATGVTGLSEISFANGVALSTLYLPEGIRALNLTEANNLRVLLKSYTTPTTIDGKLTAQEGLYLQGFFEEPFTSQINSIRLSSGALKESSYDIFTRFLDKKLGVNSSTSTIKILKADWSPYVKLVEGDIYDSDYESSYYYDTNHNYFEQYDYISEEQFNKDVLNGNVYRKRNDFSANTVNAYTYLQNLAQSNLTYELSGSLWINNSELDTNFNELDVYSLISTKFPNLLIYFEDGTKISQSYVAKFTSYDDTKDIVSQVYDDNGTPIIQKTLDSEFDVPSFSPSKSHYIFVGWSPVKIGTIFTRLKGYYYNGKFYENEVHTKLIDKEEDSNKYIYEDLSSENNDVYSFDMDTQTYCLINNLSTTSGKYTYVYYAVFQKDEYTMTYHMGNDKIETVIIQYGDPIIQPTTIPYQSDVNQDLEKCYKHIGYSRTRNGPPIKFEGLRANKNEQFYALFEEGSVYDNVHEEYFDFTLSTSYSDTADNDKYGIPGKCYLVKPKSSLTLQGKITIPIYYNNLPVYGIQGFAGQSNITHIFFEKDSAEKPCKIRTIEQGAFKDLNKLVYFDFIDSIRIIKKEAFSGSNLSLVTSIQSTNGVLREIGESAFNKSYIGVGSSGNGINEFSIKSSLLTIFGSLCFAYLNKESSIETLKINAQSLSSFGTSAFAQNTKSSTATNKKPYFSTIITYQLNDSNQGSFENMFNSTTLTFEHLPAPFED